MPTERFKKDYDSFAEANDHCQNPHKLSVAGYSEVYSEGAPVQYRTPDGKLRWKVNFRRHYG